MQKLNFFNISLKAAGFWAKFDNGLCIQGGAVSYGDDNTNGIKIVNLYVDYINTFYTIYLTDVGDIDLSISTHKVCTNTSGQYAMTNHYFYVKHNGTGSDPFTWMTIGRWKE